LPVGNLGTPVPAKWTVEDAGPYRRDVFHVSDEVAFATSRFAFGDTLRVSVG